MGELSNYTLSELRQGLDRGDFSAIELALDLVAIANEQKHLNAFTSLDVERITSEAALADKKIQELKGNVPPNQPLLGIPVAIKDMISVKGQPTTCASKILENYVAPYDATVVAKLKEAGAIMFGKTNMDEFAMGSSNENSSYGPVANPWDLSRVPGGSSGGSAAAVSAGIVPAALGTDTGGSIRQPAALCSLVGIKPTYGRVSRYGVVAYASSLDQVGPLTRNVHDAATMVGVISGQDDNDSTSVARAVPDYAAVLGKPIKGLRLGVPKEYFIAGVSAEVDTAVKNAIKQLVSLGAEVVDISLPHTDAGVAAYYIVAPAEASSNLARYDGVRFGYRAKDPVDLKDMYNRSRGEGFGTEVKRRIMMGTYVLSSGYYDAYYARAQKIRTLIARDFYEAFSSKCDLVVCPTAPTTAFKLAEKVSDPLAMYLNDVFTIPVNLAGLPAMSLPCGFDGAGLPIGLQFIGKPFDEAGIFKAAFAYESSSEWHKRKPKRSGEL